MSESKERVSLWLGAAVALLLGCYVGQVWLSMIKKSATLDEQVYAFAGYTYFETGRYDLKQDAPPMIPVLSASAIKIYQWLGNPINVDPNALEQLPEIRQHWHQRSIESDEEYKLARKFFSDNDGPRLIQIARIPIGLLGALLGLYLFRFAAGMFGNLAGLVCLALFVVDPNLIGHGRVVSADLGLACFFLMTLFYLHQSIVEDRFSNQLCLAICAAVCCCVKLSGLIVFPTLLLISGITLAFPPAKLLENLDQSQSDFRKGLLRKAIVAIVLVVPLSWLLLSVVYLDWRSPVLFYEATKTIYSNVPSDYTSYLMGEFQPKFWLYNPLATFFKSPLSTSVLFFVSVFLFSSRIGIARRFCYVPIVVALGISEFDGINIGLRRVLLTIPFYYLTIGGFVHFASTSKPGLIRTLSKFVVVASLVWSIFSAMSIFPNHLSFFSSAIGGPANGHKYLAESNLSWGQNLPALSSYLQEQNIEEVIMHYYGGDNLHSYDIKATKYTPHHIYWPLQKVYVLSAHSMIQFLKNNDEGCNWFEREPSEIINHTLYVFDLRDYPDHARSPENSLKIARNFVNEKKLGDSIIHFQAYLKANPDDREVHAELAEIAEKFEHPDLMNFHRKLADKKPL